MLGRDLVQLKFENDLFAAQGRDRFRTGAFGVSYLQDQLKYHLTVLMWTGETRGSVWTKASTPLMPNGFKSIRIPSVIAMTAATTTVPISVEMGMLSVLLSTAHLETSPILGNAKLAR